MCRDVLGTIDYDGVLFFLGGEGSANPSNYSAYSPDDVPTL